MTRACLHFLTEKVLSHSDQLHQNLLPRKVRKKLTITLAACIIEKNNKQLSSNILTVKKFARDIAITSGWSRVG